VANGVRKMTQVTYAHCHACRDKTSCPTWETPCSRLTAVARATIAVPYTAVARKAYLQGQALLRTVKWRTRQRPVP